MLASDIKKLRKLLLVWKRFSFKCKYRKGGACFLERSIAGITDHGSCNFHTCKGGDKGVLKV